MVQKKQPSVWLLIDDRAGNRSQVLGVAEALGWPNYVQELDYTAAAALPNKLLGSTLGGLTASSRINLVAPWPDLVIAAGRRTAPVARHIKEKNKRTFLCQIMYPGEAGADEFDLIAVPKHDGIPPRDNLLQMTGAPHRITAARLAQEKEAWQERFAHLPKPWIGLIVGGTNKRRVFTDEMARELGQKANAMAKSAGGSLLITTSRRTGEAADQLFAAIDVPNFAFKWGDEGENPYFGYLSCADSIVVTGDSVSMCSEACASPAPVYIYAPKRLVAYKHNKLHKDLYEQGFARPLGDTFEEWTHPPLNAAAEIAEAIRYKFQYPPTNA